MIKIEHDDVGFTAVDAAGGKSPSGEIPRRSEVAALIGGNSFHVATLVPLVMRLAVLLIQGLVSSG